MNYASVQFFMQSARRIQPDFTLNHQNMAAVVQICHLVQGLPLGILLAASWLSMLSPQEIVDEIKQNLDFLNTDLQDLPERHRSIRAIFDYSWNLMSETEQQVFMKLSVFRGGFSRMSASAVTDANLRTLMSLITKSLIRRDPTSGRFYIHELLRQYGEEKLKTEGQYDVVTHNHAKHFLSTIAQSWVISTLKSPSTIAELTLDYDNIRMALQWGAEHRLMEEIRVIIEPLFYFSEFTGIYEGISQFQ
jgi:predicted ATPase